MEAINAEKTNISHMFVFTATFFFIFQFLLQYMPKKYEWFSNLPSHIQIGTIIRIISSFHAIIATCLSIFVLCTDEGLHNNKLIYQSFGISFTLNVSIGFLAYDCLIMFLNRNEFELGYGIHHCVSIMAFYICTTVGVFPYLALIRLISEASTVFINNRWILLSLKMKDTKLYFWNGIAVLVVFTIVRIVTIVPNWLIFFSLMETPEWNSIEFKHKFACVVSSAPLDCLNILWFTKIIRIVIKTLKSNSSNTYDSPTLIKEINEMKREKEMFEEKLLISEKNHEKTT